MKTHSRDTKDSYFPLMLEVLFSRDVIDIRRVTEFSVYFGY